MGDGHDRSGLGEPNLNNDLFIDLFAYRQRENKDPIEDWTTECLAATIRSLPSQVLAELLKEFTRADRDISVAIDAGEIEVLTQYHAGKYGRPDMLIKFNGQPWILFENKVGHAVSERENEGVQIHQLRAYADWLKEHGEDCDMPRALVFITHLTPPPRDFTAEASASLYHDFSRYHSTWGVVARKIEALTADLAEDHFAAGLSRAFSRYLKDQNMSNEFPDAVALSSAQLYVSQAASLENLVDRMWQEAAGIAACGKTASYRIKADPDYGTVNAHRYALSAPNSSSGWSYIETGVWFPELDSWYDSEEIGRDLVGPHVYVGFFNGDDDYFTMTKDAPEGFLRPASDFLAIESLSTFSADPDARGGEIVSWVAGKAAVLRPFLLERKIVS